MILTAQKALVGIWRPGDPRFSTCTINRLLSQILHPLQIDFSKLLFQSINIHLTLLQIPLGHLFLQISTPLSCISGVHLKNLIPNFKNCFGLGFCGCDARNNLFILTSQMLTVASRMCNDDDDFYICVNAILIVINTQKLHFSSKKKIHIWMQNMQCRVGKFMWFFNYWTSCRLADWPEVVVVVVNVVYFAYVITYNFARVITAILSPQTITWQRAEHLNALMLVAGGGSSIEWKSAPANYCKWAIILLLTEFKVGAPSSNLNVTLERTNCGVECSATFGPTVNVLKSSQPTSTTLTHDTLFMKYIRRRYDNFVNLFYVLLCSVRPAGKGGAHHIHLLHASAQRSQS